MSYGVDYLNSQEAAKILGVNVSTIKRWTDEGKLQCTRSAGGHRKFDMKHLARFLETNKHKSARANLFPIETEADLRLSNHIVKGNFSYLIDYLEELSLHCEREQAQKVLNGLYLAQYPLYVIYDRIITPILHRIGNRWAASDVSVIEEHLATQILRDGVIRLQGIVNIPSKIAGKVLCLTFSQEFHDIAVKMIQHIMEFRGYKAYNSGSITPLLEINAIFSEIKPERVYISSTYVVDTKTTQTEFNHVGDLCQQYGARLFIGGRGFDALSTSHTAVEKRLYTFEEVFHI